MKKVLLLLSVICINIAFSQSIGLKTSNPQGPFHLDTRGNNPATGGMPPLAQNYDDMFIDSNGNLAFGANFNPSYARPKLNLYFSTVGGDNVTIQGIMPAGAPETLSLLGAFRPSASNSYLKREQSIDAMSIPRSTVLTLNANIADFLSTTTAGGAQDIPMTVVQNPLNLTYANNFVFLPQGMYQITVLYKANHPGCSLSSYFYDFPFSTSFTRVHSNTRHLAAAGAPSTHSGKITYTTQVDAGGKNIRINLGRGQSGNCGGTGMNLLSDGTQFIITRIGD